MSITVYGCRGQGNPGCGKAYLRKTEWKVVVIKPFRAARTKHRGLCRTCALGIAGQTPYGQARLVTA